MAYFLFKKNIPKLIGEGIELDKLSEIINFNPLTAFNRLDLSSDGSISPKELTSFFYDNNQIITHHES